MNITIKLLKAFLFAGIAWNLQAAAPQWETDLAKAKTQASQQNKAILLDFTGSDWCSFCIKLKKNVFSKPEFEKFAEKNLVLVMIDFPRRKSQSKELKAANEKLRDEFKIEGYPTIVLLEPGGKELGRLEGYEDETAAQYVAKLEAILAKRGKSK